MRTVSICWLVFMAAAVSLADNKKSDGELRTIRGTVLDKDETPMPSGVVYLLNVKTQAVKTYIADDAGNYRHLRYDVSNARQLYRLLPRPRVQRFNRQHLYARCLCGRPIQFALDDPG